MPRKFEIISIFLIIFFSHFLFLQMVFPKNKAYRSWKEATSSREWAWSILDSWFGKSSQWLLTFRYVFSFRLFATILLYGESWFDKIEFFFFYSLFLFYHFHSSMCLCVCIKFSVRDGDTVKHYRIRQLDEGGFFIARRTTFR